MRWHFRNVSNEVKDGLALELVNWLESQSLWARNSGKDHVLILGKISWDFRRQENSSWGMRFLQLEQMQNPIKLLIERQPWEINEIGIPHPTYFHPHTDDDIVAWQLKIMRSHRKSLASFAGGARPGAPENIIVTDPNRLSVFSWSQSSACSPPAIARQGNQCLTLSSRGVFPCFLILSPLITSTLGIYRKITGSIRCL